VRVHLLSALLFAGVLSVSAVAQVGEPEPSPSPQPTTFVSPLNGERRLADPEGKDYTNLQQLYDFWQDDIDALERIRKCGSAQDIARAEELVQKSAQAFQDALQQYIFDWSSMKYPGKPGKNGYSEDFIQKRYDEDKQKVLDALQKNHKPFLPKTNGCPKPNDMVHPGPNGQKERPRPRSDDGGRPGGLPGDFSIGVGSGHDDRHRDDNRHDTRTPPPGDGQDH
jgi:hypothetical protein